MRPAHLAFALMAVLPLPLVAATAKPPARPAAAHDWTRTYAVTPEGGFRMGNPSARIAIVEYASLTCPHCRHFAQTGTKPLLRNYIRTGKASYEFRPVILNGLDLAANLVARCNGPAHFFPMAASLYATQPTWLAKIDGLSDAERDRLQGLPQDQMMVEFARISGLVPVAAANGIPPARAQACLKDDAAANGLAAMYQAAMDRGIKGTPTFLVNGKEVMAADWATLEPFLKDAGG